MKEYSARGGAEGRSCELCGRPAERLTRHHLIPRTRHKNKKNKKTFDRHEIHRTVDLCGPCHRHVHVTIPNKDLEREYNTVEALRDHPDVRKFVDWIKDKPHGVATAGARGAAGPVGPSTRERRSTPQSGRRGGRKPTS